MELRLDELSAINPRLILVRVSGYGQTGPYSQRAGYGGIGEAMGGLRYIVGEPDRPPSRVGISIGDSLAAVHACMGTLAALHHRDRTGAGQVVDAAIYESVLNMMESLVTEYDQLGHVRERSGPILPRIAPSNVYPTRDGIVMIGANQDTVFARLAAAMDAPALATDPRYADHQARGANQAELDAIIARWTATLATTRVCWRCSSSTAFPRGSSTARPTCWTTRISWRARPSSARRIRSSARCACRTWRRACR